MTGRPVPPNRVLEISRERKEFSIKVAGGDSDCYNGIGCLPGTHGALVAIPLSFPPHPDRDYSFSHAVTMSIYRHGYDPPASFRLSFAR
jgi:hypothetical protein